MNAKKLICIILGLVFEWGWAQIETFPVVNFSVNDYGAANQNWSVSIDSGSNVFVANHQGLLVFDGQHWSLHKLPNNTIVRSVFADNTKIYTGSYEEFGYWQRNAYGVYNYTSLTHLIDPDYEFKSEEFWEIVKWGDKIVFRSFRALYIYDGNTIEVVQPGIVINKLYPFKDKLLLGTENRGVSVFDSNKNMYRLPGTEEIATTSVSDMKATGSGELLIGTKYKGLVIWKLGKLRLGDEMLNKYLVENQLNKIETVNDHTMVFGTIKNGLIFYDLQSGEISFFNRNYGLQNNTILGLAVKNNRLWVAQDNGISLLKVNDGITFFNDLSGQLGTVYDIEFFKNTTYLGSNTGVFYFRNNELTFLKESQGHVWDLVNLGDKLLCCHNSGLFEIKDDTFIPVEGAEGTYTVVRVPGKENVFLAGTYIGLLKLTYTNGHWQVEKYSTIDFPISSIVFEKNNVIWCTHPYKGLYRILLKDNLQKVELLSFNDHKVKLTDYQTRIQRIGGKIVFYVSNKYYTYAPDSNEIVEYKEFGDRNNNKIIYNSKNSFWLINSERNRLTYHTGNTELVITDNNLLSRITPLYEKILKADDSIFMIPLNDGYAKLNLNAIIRAKALSLVSKANLLSIKTEKKSFNISEQVTIPYSQARSVSMSFAYPQEINAEFTYELKGPIDQSGTFRGGTVEFQNLTYGSYQLKIFLKDTKREVLSYQFSVSPPWYFTNLMIVVYILLLTFLIYLIYYYNDKSIKKYHRKIHQKMLEEEEKRKARLERESLQREVEMKQKELMNSTLLISKKNELLLELKNEFKRIKDNSVNVNEYRVKSLISKTTEAISNKEDWKVFETNFNELHDDFFKKLIKKHPKLTSKDLKLSAYLKMGLMSKEIAPLMGLTTRGVELHRYRLRKKLDLDGGQDLIKYLLLF